MWFIQISKLFTFIKNNLKVISTISFQLLPHRWKPEPR
ncbi:hypothetical protein J837_3514 [Acinetobacter baumannii 25935_4]|nr:hypothetical protein J837_3514 [Acinetobacter baumannii 25935_4]